MRIEINSGINVNSERELKIQALKSLLFKQKSQDESGKDQGKNVILLGESKQLSDEVNTKVVRFEEVCALKRLLLVPSQASNVSCLEDTKQKRVKNSNSSQRATPSGTTYARKSPTLSPEIKNPQCVTDTSPMFEPYYAGSAFLNSPCPDAIPLPDFDEQIHFDLNTSSENNLTTITKTQSLRLLLKI